MLIYNIYIYIHKYIYIYINLLHIATQCTTSSLAKRSAKLSTKGRSIHVVYKKNGGAVEHARMVMVMNGAKFVM